MRLVLFVLYILFLLKVIVFKYPIEQLQDIANGWQSEIVAEGLLTANYTPFQTIGLYIKYYDMPGIHGFANLYGNILVFIPFGLLLAYNHPSSRNMWVLLLNSFLFVGGIEVFQLVSSFGVFDVDDIILNCTGALLGGLLYKFCASGSEKYRKD